MQRVLALETNPICPKASKLRSATTIQTQANSPRMITKTILSQHRLSVKANITIRRSSSPTILRHSRPMRSAKPFTQSRIPTTLMTKSISKRTHTSQLQKLRKAMKTSTAPPLARAAASWKTILDKTNRGTSTRPQFTTLQWWAQPPSTWPPLVLKIKLTSSIKCLKH